MRAESKPDKGPAELTKEREYRGNFTSPRFLSVTGLLLVPPRGEVRVSLLWHQMSSLPMHLLRDSYFAVFVVSVTLGGGTAAVAMWSGLRVIGKYDVGSGFLLPRSVVYSMLAFITIGLTTLGYRLGCSFALQHPRLAHVDLVRPIGAAVGLGTALLAANGWAMHDIARRALLRPQHPDGSAGLAPIASTLVANSVPLGLGTSFLVLSLWHPGLHEGYKVAVVQALPIASLVALLIAVPPFGVLQSRIAEHNRQVASELQLVSSECWDSSVAVLRDPRSERADLEKAKIALETLSTMNSRWSARLFPSRIMGLLSLAWPIVVQVATYLISPR